MFTGLVRELGQVAGLTGHRLCIDCPGLRHELIEGASVAANGVCLTVADLTGAGFCADLLSETLAATNLGQLGAGQAVNLELPLRAAEGFGGHFVLGHIDGTVRLITAERRTSADGTETRLCRFELPDWLRLWMLDKGSIALDGVSLTVQSIEGESFSVALIPETLNRTTLGDIQPGQAVNVEADMLTKAVVRAAQALLEGRRGTAQSENA